MSLMEELRALLHQFDEERDAAGDLWSWLPSAQEAKAHHGDYYYAHRPAPADVMREAARYLAVLTGSPPSEEDRELFKCPCGDSHDAEGTASPKAVLEARHTYLLYRDGRPWVFAGTEATAKTQGGEALFRFERACSAYACLVPSSPRQAESCTYLTMLSASPSAPKDNQ